MAAALLIAAAAAVAAPAPVTAVDLEAIGARDIGRLRQVLGVRAGDRFSRLELRRGVQALIASGEAALPPVSVAPVSCDLWAV